MSKLSFQLPSDPSRGSRVPNESSPKFLFEDCEFSGSCKAFIKYESGPPAFITFNKMNFRGAGKVVEGKNVHVDLKDVDIK